MALSVPDTDYAVEAVEHICTLYKGNSLQETDAMRALAPTQPGTKLAARASLEAGKLLLERDQTTAALPFMETAAALADKLPSMKPTLAEMASQEAGAANLLERQGRASWPAAVAKWRLVSEIETRPIQRGDALVNKAGLLRALRDYGGARADCAVVLADPVMKADRPLFEKARLLTMLCYDEEGSYAEALTRCKEIIADPVDLARYKPAVQKLMEGISAKVASGTATPDGGVSRTQSGGGQ